jgi:histidinol-phosphate aminotransferase
LFVPKTPEEIIREEIRALTAYHVPDATGMVKLDAMENPYRLPAALRERLAQLVQDAPLNRYPDPAAVSLKAQLTGRWECPPAWIFCSAMARTS